MVRLIELVERVAASHGADTYFSESELIPGLLPIC